MKLGGGHAYQGEQNMCVMKDPSRMNTISSTKTKNRMIMYDITATEWASLHEIDIAFLCNFVDVLSTFIYDV